MAIRFLSLGDTEQSIQLNEAQLKIAQEIGDMRSAGYALFNLSEALYRVGRQLDAIKACQESLAILEKIKTPLALRARARLSNWRAPVAAQLLEDN
jgi:tetratricopeptide (TPR) repeat protein